MPPPLKTTCCIVGAGPAGVLLAHLLAMQGIAVTLLESEADFDRNFRGDTVHPSTMEIMEQLGFVEELYTLPHEKEEYILFNGVKAVGFESLPCKYKHVTLIHQKDFLSFITQKSSAFPNYTLLMETHAQKLVEKEGRVIGVECLQKGQPLTIHADLVVGADGRFSRMRKEGGFESESKSAPMDVLWFRLPKLEDEDRKMSTGGYLGKGSMLVQLEREDHWQLGLIIRKGSYGELRDEGFPHFQETVSALVPRFKERMQALDGWKGNVSLLNVESTMVKQWYREGLLLIGDAAHIMSPLGGVGINFAVKDAVTAANLLSQPLKKGTLTSQDLAKVQARRKGPTQRIQRLQHFGQSFVLAPTLNHEAIPLFIRLLAKSQFVRRRVARSIGLGFQKVLIDEALLAPKDS